MKKLMTLTFAALIALTLSMPAWSQTPSTTTPPAASKTDKKADKTAPAKKTTKAKKTAKKADKKTDTKATPADATKK